MKLNRILNILPLMVFAAADDCQPYTWGRKRSEGDNFPPPGTIVCRLNGTSPAEVNYYTCKEMAVKYKIKVEEFFTLNPQVDQDCKTIKPMTPYCVKGFIAPLISKDGFCGPQHNNATCKYTDFPCCNAETWRCGLSEEDCRPGTCYEGGCPGATVYSIDGKCGSQNKNLLCGGKWGDCCNNDGNCGTGEDFCNYEKCQSGDCYIQQPPVSSASQTSSGSLSSTTTISAAPTAN